VLEFSLQHRLSPSAYLESAHWGNVFNPRESKRCNDLQQSDASSRPAKLAFRGVPERTDFCCCACGFSGMAALGQAPPRRQLC
jgi:hypothetical protein